MMNTLRIFKPGVALTIKLTFVVALASAFFVTFAWGYESRQQARRWREVACSYRLLELQRAAPGLGTGSTPCAALDTVGLSLVARAR